MRKVFLSLFTFFLIAISFCFVNVVKAYEENAFTDGKCVSNDSWQDKAYVNYSLDDTKGIYVTSGQTYKEYVNSGSAEENVFYVVSNDGKVLYGIVPNYDTSMATSSIKSEVFEKGIVTTASCKNTYVAAKTVIGNPPTTSSYINFDGSSDNSFNQENTSSSDGSLDKSAVTKLSSPNTGDSVAFSVILISLILIFTAVYSLYISTNNSNSKKKTNA